MSMGRLRPSGRGYVRVGNDSYRAGDQPEHRRQHRCGQHHQRSHGAPVLVQDNRDRRVRQGDLDDGKCRSECHPDADCATEASDSHEPVEDDLSDAHQSLRTG